MARSLNVTCLVRHDLRLREEERLQGKEPSIWVVVSRRREDLGSLAENPRWRQPEDRPGAKPWTDDYANVVTAFKWE